MTAPVPASQPPTATLDAVAAQVGRGSPTDLYRQADLFDRATARLQNAVDQLRHHLRELDEAWQGAGSDGYFEQAGVVSSRVDEVIRATRNPSYGALLRYSGDALTESQRRLGDLQAQRAQSKVISDAETSFYDYQAQQVLQGLSNSFTVMGSQLGELPAVAASGTPISSTGQVSLLWSPASTTPAPSGGASGQRDRPQPGTDDGRGDTRTIRFGGSTPIGYPDAPAPDTVSTGWGGVSLAGSGATDVLSSVPGRTAPISGCEIRRVDPSAIGLLSGTAVGQLGHAAVPAAGSAGMVLAGATMMPAVTPVTPVSRRPAGHQLASTPEELAAKDAVDARATSATGYTVRGGVVRAERGSRTSGTKSEPTNQASSAPASATNQEPPTSATGAAGGRSAAESDFGVSAPQVVMSGADASASANQHDTSQAPGPSPAPTGAPLSAMADPSSATSRAGQPGFSTGAVGQPVACGDERQRSVKLSADAECWEPDDGWLVLGRQPRSHSADGTFRATGKGHDD